MKTKILILLVCFLLSCEKKVRINEKANHDFANKQISLIRDIQQFKNYASVYQSDKINFSDNNELNKFDLDFIYNSTENIDKDKLKRHITNLLLLKQYLFHLSKYNQGYDLLTMRNGQAEFVINYFLTSNKINSEKEFINSSYPYELLKNEKDTDKEIANLIQAIRKQEERILKQQN